MTNRWSCVGERRRGSLSPDLPRWPSHIWRGRPGRGASEGCPPFQPLRWRICVQSQQRRRRDFVASKFLGNFLIFMNGRSNFLNNQYNFCQLLLGLFFLFFWVTMIMNTSATRRNGLVGSSDHQGQAKSKEFSSFSGLHFISYSDPNLSSPLEAPIILLHQAGDRPESLLLPVKHPFNLSTILLCPT